MTSENTNLDAAASNMPTAKPKPRLQWLDTVRGILLLAMASYHFMWDLAEFEYLAGDFPSHGWPKIYARSIATSFLFIAGFSLVLAHGNGIRWKKFVERLAMIIGGAIIVSVFFYIFMPEGFVFFGILHAMAVASVLALPFLRAPVWLILPVSIAIIATPFYVSFEALDTPWLWWIGLSTDVRRSFDFVPILPWFGPFLIGIAIAKLTPVQNWLRQKTLGINTPNRATATLSYLGRHSLVFYLIHQPVMYSMVYLFSLVVPAPQVPPETRYIQSCERSCSAGQDARFCKPFCGCTLTRLQQMKLLAPFQSGAISMANDERIKAIAIECTTLSE